ncbi:MAG: ATP-dependent RNA helicase HrpA [Neisseriaceae bacterium]|nr:ATP-dependent RNA helicase HrpA [Neisseriaceae bacterium]MBP6862280.1 ATP-dependent RNA helicase HrpA [Neisseriaceae bacterium]
MSEPNFSQVLTKDRHFLQLAYKQPKRHGGLEAVDKKYAQSHAAYLARLARLPQPSFDDALPVNQKLDELKALINDHQVVIICGETGSGKTTQIPKICLTLGRGVKGLIGHTQPRRLAARSVATRIAEELDTPIGEAVGFKVRFTDHSKPTSYIKLMTDGILLAETQTDRYLNQYDTLIIDEAHERSLNIDFLLGFLKQLLPKRPDLKVIITSATIDADRFSKHFNDAPVMEVSGRTFPVEVRYRPLEALKEASKAADLDPADLDYNDAIVDAVDELSRLGAGDILVFLPGEREIRDATDALRKSHIKHYDILPLFARLSNADQQRIFHPNGSRRIVLATNVAETSLTVPGINYVIDTGLARVKRYSVRAKVEQLHVEKIAQSAANQRSGRCGRVAAGVCIRLYAEDDFKQRPAFTDPEILRSNLAAVILRMAALRLGDVAQFPFLEAPASRYIADGYQVLHELGAIKADQSLTEIGTQLARLPIDPKIGRMLLAAHKHTCLQEALIIVAALSIQDPRERPFEAREAAHQAHLRFADKESDFLSYVHLWQFYEEALHNKSSQRQLAQLCKQHFLSPMRMREWRELYKQLKDICQELGFKPNALPATPEQIHRALLTGLIGNVGMKAPEGNDYLGVRGIHFHLFPASNLFKAKPKWVFAAELTDTSKLYARDVGKLNPEWIEAEVPHLVKYHYFDPHWEKARGEVVASERVTLYSLTVNPRRPVQYGPIDPETAHELFIRGALVEQEWDTKAPFFSHNRRLIKDVLALEHKSRRQDVLVDDEVLYGFYAAKIPATICDIRSFEKWRKSIEAENPKHLYLSRDDLMQHAAEHVTEAQFPEWWHNDDGKFKLSYRFEPNHVLDGVTLHVPLTVLNRLNPARLEWLVPGMIREKLTLLMKALPKQQRRTCVPVPDFITGFLSRNPNTDEPLLPQLAHHILRHTGGTVIVDIDAWQQMPLPAHCQVNIRVLDDGKRELAMGRDLRQLQQQLGKAAQLTFRDNTQEFEREDIQDWDLGTLPESIQFARGKQQLTGYLGLKLEEGRIALRLFDTADSAEAAHRLGVIALMQKQLRDHMKDLNKGIPGFTQVAMQLKHLGNADKLLADINHAICDRAFIGEDALPRTEKDFKEQIKRARSRLPAVKQGMSQMLSQIAEGYGDVQRKLGKHPLSRTLSEQMQRLIYPGFVSATPWTQLPHLPRYLKAMLLRMDKYMGNAGRDDQREQEIMALWQTWHDRIQLLRQQNIDVPADLLAFQWQLEELRVSLFAQELKTPMPVSVKRLQKQWDALTKQF